MSFYSARLIYYNSMKQLIDGEITHWEYRDKYMEQKRKPENEEDSYDIYEKKFGRKKFDEFQRKYIFYLFEEGGVSNCEGILKEFEEGAKKYGVTGIGFFGPILEFTNIDTQEYLPSSHKYFDPEEDVGEEELEKLIKAAYEVLERNKDRWM